ncbi:MAG: pantetheine-phosphate adenylyltransferase [Burkholderiales bacterium]|nr:pantetheine-phosphate adenylyltransferase [Burkholderiales bacterium]
MWVIAEARAMAEKVVVFLSENTLKAPQFPAHERKRIIEQSTLERGWDNVEVVIVRGDYTARVAKNHGIDYLIRGIRNTSDFDYENLIQQTNVDVLHGAKTMFVMPPRDLGSVSSSFVRALQGPVGWHWHMKKFVPGPAYYAWIIDWLRKEWMGLWNYPELSEPARAHCEHYFALLTQENGYGGPNRHYHNCDHLVHGLTEIRAWAANTDASPAAIASLKKAFWFHDAVYHQNDPRISDEEASAQFWLDAQLQQKCGLAEDDAVAQLIRVTDHFQESQIDHPLKNVMLGVDLAILGQDDDIYDIYAKAIRAEYSQVAQAEYRSKRGAAMRHLQQKAESKMLFTHPYFADHYNARAIQNMQRELHELDGMGE